MPDIILPNRCCQLIIKKQLYIDLYEVDEEKNLYNTTRNEGGFGSTG
jgi:dUTPase